MRLAAGTLSCPGLMIGAAAASRCPKSTHLTGPVGSDATPLGIGDQKQPRRCSSCTKDINLQGKKTQSSWRNLPLCHQRAACRAPSIVFHLTHCIGRPLKINRGHSAGRLWRCGGLHVLRYVPNNASDHSYFTCGGNLSEEKNHWLGNCLPSAVQLAPASRSIVLCSYMYGLPTVASISLWSCEPRQEWY